MIMKCYLYMQLTYSKLESVLEHDFRSDLLYKGVQVPEKS